MRDPVDEQIRALVARAVAQAPPPASASDIGRRGPEPRGRSVGRASARRRAHPPTSGRRAVLVAAAAVVAVAVGVVASHGRGHPSDDVDLQEQGTDPAGRAANGLRYVPTALGEAQLVAVDDTVAAPDVDGAPVPAVSLFRSEDGVQVRVTRGQPAMGSSPTSSTPSTSPTSPSTTTTVLATGPGTTPATPGPATTTTSIPALPADVPPRSGVEPVTVRGTGGAVERHGPDATTFWFVDRGDLVAVDVLGLDRAGSLALVEALEAQPQGGLAPPADDAAGLEAVSEEAADPADDRRPATTRLEYQLAAGSTPRRLTVTTTALDRQRQELLVATAGYFGRVERWDGREVLVDRGSPAGVAAAFVDDAPALVVVAAATEADARMAVEALDGLDPGAWRVWLRSASDDLAAQPVVASALVGTEATVTERQPEGGDPTSGPRGHCLELPDTDPVCRPVGSSLFGAEGPPPGVGHQALVAGDWWYFGYVPGTAAITVAPDRGPDPDVRLTDDDGRTWFAVPLPPAATTASVRIDAPGLTGSVATTPTAVDILRPAT